MEIITRTCVGFVDTENDVQSVVIVTLSVFCSKAVSLQYSVYSLRHACDNIIYIIYRNII